MAPSIIFRVDSSPRIGSGHAVRCLALAGACRADGWSVTFVMRESLPGFKQALERRDAAFVGIDPADQAADARMLSRIARDSSAAWIVVDGYRFTASYRQRIERDGARLLVIDDLGDLGPYACDAVHNQNVDSTSSLYGDSANGVLWLLGPRYALLRPEFAAARRPRPKLSPNGKRILVSFGGSDPKEQTIPVLRALDRVDGPALEITVVIGPGFRRVEAIRRAARSSRHDVRVLERVSDLSALMAACSLAVLAAGTTLWEAAYMGAPTVGLVVVDNQAPGAATFEMAGAGLVLDAREGLNGAMLGGLVSRLLSDSTARMRIAKAGQALIDGRGAVRTARALLQEGW